MEGSRKSGIELVKIIAMILIVISHIIRSLTYKNGLSGCSMDYVIDISRATADYKTLTIACLSMLGSYGNTIFFACSAWFLINSKTIKIDRMVEIISDVWVVNVLILTVIMLTPIQVPKTIIVRSLFPTIYAWNWYITVYLMVYAMHTSLNKIVFSLSKRQLLIVNSMLFLMYGVIDYLLGEHFFPNAVTYFIVLYFFVAYIRLYMSNFCKNKLLNVILLIIGTIMPFVLTFLTNYLGLYVSFFSTSDHYLRWGGMNSPFIIMAAVSLINIGEMVEFQSKIVNYISGCSLIVYISHANHLISNYVMPRAWITIQKSIGYNHLLTIVFVFSFLVFVVALMFSALYKHFLARVSHYVGEKVFRVMKSWFLNMIDMLIKLE